MREDSWILVNELLDPLILDKVWVGGRSEIVNVVVVVVVRHKLDGLMVGLECWVTCKWSDIAPCAHAHIHTHIYISMYMHLSFNPLESRYILLWTSLFFAGASAL